VSPFCVRNLYLHTIYDCYSAAIVELRRCSWNVTWYRG